MELKLKDEIIMEADYGAGEGTEEKYIYECPCGEGEIIEEHTNVPGFRDHDVYMRCDKCSQEWKIVGTSHGWSVEKK